MEILCLIQHAGFLQTIAEHLHIIRIERTRIFLDFIVVRIGLELSRLVRDDGYGLRPRAALWESQLAAFLKVHHRVRVEVVDHTAISRIGK